MTRAISVEPGQGDPRQRGTGIHRDGHDLHSPLGKGFPLEEGWKLEQLVGLVGGGEFGVHRHGKPQLLPHGDELVGILRVADPGDGVLGTQLFGRETGEQVQLIQAGGGDEESGFPGSGLPQDRHGCAVARYRHHVQLFNALAEYLGVGVDDGDVVPLRRELGGQGGAYLAVAHDDDVHSVSTPYRKFPDILKSHYSRKYRSCKSVTRLVYWNEDGRFWTAWEEKEGFS